jgi:Plavaka transposase
MADGTFLSEPVPVPEPIQPLDATPENKWAPFPDRLAFDWAHYHFVRLQSSEETIATGLDLWRATVIKHAAEHRADGHVPWRDAQDLYRLLDSIQAGAVGWKTYKFRYTGPKPQTPPLWMEATYELNARDVLVVLEQQLATTEFNGQCDYVPYAEFDRSGHRILSNLMSASWANREAVKISLKDSYIYTYITGMIVGQDRYGCIHTWLNARTRGFRQ